MIIKYKDKEYNIDPNYQSLINLKNQCFNNHFHFIMKEALKNEEFSKWFYSEYESVSDFNNNKNRCENCGKKTAGKYCRECRKTDKIKAIIHQRKCETKLKKYGDKNYNNPEKNKQTCLDRYGFEYSTQVPEFVEKSKQTFLRKYGVTNPNKCSSVRNKIKQTNLEKYGVEYALQLPDVIEKRINTNLEKYGVENVRQSPIIKNKIKLTKLERYGNENYNNINKSKQTNLKKYGFKYAAQVPEFKEKNKKTCLEKYGVEYALQVPEIREKIKQTCLEKYNVEYVTQMHFKNINDLNENYVKENFIKNNRFLIQEFMEYFNFEYTCALNYKKLFNIQEPNKTNLYKTQQFIFDNIKTENKIFNDRTVLDGKELDIYLPDIKLAIEYNGLLYHSEGLSSYTMFNTSNVDKNYHLNKTLECQKLGITLFHIFEGENLDLWLSMINNKLGLNKRIFARKCYIAELKSKDIINFLNDNHIQGYVQSSINLGLFYTDGVELPKLVSVMTFSKPRFNKKYEYELIRFCSLKNTSVIGGANKLLKYFINKYNPKLIISYANRRFSNGSIYETLGFKKIGASSPNYFYFKDSSVLESRNKYQKHKLSNLLEEFDPNLTESENMFKNGYRRIYDCGNLVYELVL